MKQYMVIDIGGTQIKYGVVNEMREFLFKKEVKTKAHNGGGYVMEKAELLISEVQTLYTLDGVCISTAGMVDEVKGTILFANENIPGYTGMEIKKRIEDKFHLICEVENDVACAGLCEVYYGAAKGSKSCVCITVGTGIGGCVILNGQVYRGCSNAAGSIGYLPLFPTTLEAEASMRALENRINENEVSKEVLSGEEIFLRAKNNDIHCQNEIAYMCDRLGYGIACICCILNPEVVVIGGGVATQGKEFQMLVKMALKKYLEPEIEKNTRLELAEYRNCAGMLGAFQHYCMRQEKKNDRV